MLQRSRRAVLASDEGMEDAISAHSAPSSTSSSHFASPNVSSVDTAYPSLNASRQLIREWEELAARTRASPYLRPGWVDAWWRAFGKGRLEIRILRRRRRLVALLPLAVHHGTRESTSNYHSPRAGLLAEDMRAAVELALALYAGRPRRLSLTCLDPVGMSLDACRWAAEMSGYKSAARPYQRSPYLDITMEWSAYEGRLSKSLRANLRRAKSRLARRGRISVEMLSGRDCTESSLQEAFAVEAAGWKGARHTAILSSPDTRRFYTYVARWAAAQGMLRLFLLRVDGRTIAMYYALEDQDTCYLLKGGYDSAYLRYSPGKLLLHSVVSHCFAAGLTRVEFHGNAEAYKFQWANAVHEQKRFEAYLPTPAGRLRWATFAYLRPLTRRALRLLHHYVRSRQ